jgi:hypothetical protein
MDDFLLLSNSQSELHSGKHQIEKFLNEQLTLELHPIKRQIFPTNTGIDFLGYTVWNDHRKLRRRNVNRFISRLCEFDKLPMITPFAEASLMGWKGYSIHADAFGLTEQLYKMHPSMQVFALENYAKRN